MRGWIPRYWLEFEVIFSWKWRCAVAVVLVSAPPGRCFSRIATEVSSLQLRNGWVANQRIELVMDGFVSNMCSYRTRTSQ